MTVRKDKPLVALDLRATSTRRDGAARARARVSASSLSASPPAGRSAGLRRAGAHARKVWRGEVRDLPARRPEHRRVGGDEQHALTRRCSDREALEQRVGVAARSAPRASPSSSVLADPVEDDDAAGAAGGDEARERVDELACPSKPTCVEQVVAVEEVERRVGHQLSRDALAPRLVEQEGGRDADVERSDLAGERDRDERVAAAARRAAAGRVPSAPKTSATPPRGRSPTSAGRPRRRRRRPRARAPSPRSR